MVGWVAAAIALATVALVGCRTVAPGPDDPTAVPTIAPPPAPAVVSPTVVRPAPPPESPQEALERRAAEAYALYGHRQLRTFHERFTTPRYQEECVASDPARLRDQPPPRLTVFGFEAITLLELRPTRVTVDGSEGLVEVGLFERSDNLGLGGREEESERWVRLDGEWYMEDLAVRCSGQQGGP